MASIHVKQIMTKRPAVCFPNTNLQEVARLMVDNDCGALPVVNSLTDRKPLGIITDRDIVVRGVIKNVRGSECTVSECMTKNIVTIDQDAGIMDALKLMKNEQIRRLVVIDRNGHVEGVISQADIALSLSENAVGQLVETISQPVGV